MALREGMAGSLTGGSGRLGMDNTFYDYTSGVRLIPKRKKKKNLKRVMIDTGELIYI